MLVVCGILGLWFLTSMIGCESRLWIPTAIGTILLAYAVLGSVP